MGYSTELDVERYYRAPLMIVGEGSEISAVSSPRNSSAVGCRGRRSRW
jgi:hypothetical protein